MEAIDNLISLLEENDPNLDLIDRTDIEHLLQKLDQSSSPHLQDIPSKHKNKKKSDKFPALALKANVQAFVKQTTNEIKNLKFKRDRVSNISTEEQDILHDLSINPMITVKPSDKGGNIVIMDNEQYIHICTIILNNKSWYARVITTKIDQF